MEEQTKLNLTINDDYINKWSKPKTAVKRKEEKDESHEITKDN